MSQNEQKSLIDTFKSYPFKFKELSLDLIETDLNQPRKLFELRNGGDHSRLLKSVQHYGIEEPIKVCEVGTGTLHYYGRTQAVCLRQRVEV